MFESIINNARDNFGLGDKAGSLVSSLLGIIANPANGGFSGFVERFREAGLGDAVDSWIGAGTNQPITDEEVETAFGSETVDELAVQSGLDRNVTVSALGTITPEVVDALTPDAKIPDDESLMERISGFLSEFGGAVGAAVLGGLASAGALAGSAAGKAGEVAGAAVGAGKEAVGKGAEFVGDAAGATVDAGKKVVGAVGDVFDGDADGGGILQWLLPLLILVGLIILGVWFCGKSTPTATAPNANVSRSNSNTTSMAKSVESSFSIVAKDGKYVVTGVVQDQKTFDEIKAKLEAQFGAANVDVSGLRIDTSAKPFAAGWWDGFQKLLPNLKDWKEGTLSFAGNAITAATGLPAAALEQLKSLFAGWTMPTIGAEEKRSLTEVSLPNGTKLQAYPGGIEDQLIKFLGSDDYKNGTAESLKDKWFNFDDLNFSFGTTELAPESKRQLDNIVAILKAFPDAKIKIGGYTDKKGDDAANKKLSDERAKAVKAALERAGVGSQVPEAEGYGEQFATVPETASDDERKIDRKTSIRLLK